MVRLLLFALLVITTPFARAQDVSEADARLELELEQLPEAPYEQEMILLTVRGFYAVPITLEKMRQPSLDDFGWMQLGRDQWRDELVEGRKLRVYERHLALFPRRAGTLEIGRFEHQLTLLDSSSKRFAHSVMSATATLDVRAKPGAQGWWLPARALTFSDEWDKPPETLEYGGALKRTITITAKGVTPDMLPPQPEMKGRGLIAFPDPEQRGIATVDGLPEATVVWRWTVRMLSPDTGPLETSPLQWFDARERLSKPLAIAPVTVAIAGTPAIATPQDRAGFGRLALAAALAAGLIAGFGLLLPGWRLKPWREIKRAFTPAFLDPRVRAIRRAARAGDAAALWLAADDGPEKDELERHLFGSSETSIDLMALARRLAAAPRRPRIMTHLRH